MPFRVQMIRQSINEKHIELQIDGDRDIGTPNYSCSAEVNQATTHQSNERLPVVH